MEKSLSKHGFMWITISFCIVLVLIFSYLFWAKLYNAKQQKTFFFAQTETAFNKSLQYQILIGYLASFNGTNNFKQDVVPVSSSDLYLYVCTNLLNTNMYNPAHRLEYYSHGKRSWSYPIQEKLVDKNDDILDLQSVEASNDGSIVAKGVFYRGFPSFRLSIFNKRLPNTSDNSIPFIVKFNSTGKVLWLHFLHDKNIQTSSMIIYHNSIFFSALDPDEDILRISCLDLNDGKQLWIKETSITKNDYFGNTPAIHYTSHGIHLSYIKYLPDQGNPTLKLKTFSYEGDLLWEKELHLPQAITYSLANYFDSSLQICSNKDQLFFALTFQDKDWKNKTSNYQEFFQLWSLSPEGTLLWDYASTPDQEVKVRAMAADDQLLYLAGTTSTDYLKPELSTFQPARAGERDLFLMAIDRMGQQVWNSYLGGSNEEDPEVGRFMDADSSRPFSSVFLRVQGDRLVLAGTTYSQDFPVFQRDMRHFNPIETASADSQQDSLAPAYAVMSVWDTQGQLQWSSYLSTDATTEQLEATPASTFQIKTPQQIQEWIWDVTIDGKKIYILSDTNNPHTLLYRTQRDRVKVVQKQGYDRLTFQLLSILDLE